MGSKKAKNQTKTEIEVNAVLKSTEDAQKLIKDNTKKTMKLLERLIKETPEVEAIRWSQYVPGFNDGEPCEFSVNDLEIKFNSDLLPVGEEKKYDDNGEEEEDDKFVNEYDLKDFFERQIDVLNYKEVDKVERIANLFCKIHGTLANSSGALQEAFGDNAQITVTKDGIEKEEYDCGF